MFLYRVFSYTESSMVIDKEFRVREGAHFGQFWCVLLQVGDLCHGTVPVVGLATTPRHRESYPAYKNKACPTTL